MSSSEQPPVTSTPAAPAVPAQSPETAAPATTTGTTTETTAATPAPPPTSDLAPLEVDDGNDGASDVDSALDDRISSYTASLSSSVLNYPMEHGRRYHAFRHGSYILPNDELEMERLDLAHVLEVKGCGNKLFLAPVEGEKMQRILDIGTGTGIWAIEIGDMFPNAEVLGNDLSAIQPAWVPPNVKFEIDDVESSWLHSTPFDWIFCRYMTCCILDWPKLVGNFYDNISPGGWVEIQDYDLLYYADDDTLENTDTLKWITTLISAADKLGRDPRPGRSLEKWVRDAGFENVVHTRFKLPLGPWPKDPHKKDVGMCNLVQTLDGLEGFSLRLFCGVLGWTEEEVLVLLASVRKEMKSGGVHAIFDYHVVYGQKPGGN